MGYLLVILLQWHLSEHPSDGENESPEVRRLLVGRHFIIDVDVGITPSLLHVGYDKIRCSITCQ